MESDRNNRKIYRRRLRIRTRGGKKIQAVGRFTRVLRFNSSQRYNDTGTLVYRHAQTIRGEQKDTRADTHKNQNSEQSSLSNVSAVKDTKASEEGGARY